jgi:hypothetical protein
LAAWNAWIVGIVIAALALATLTVFSEWEEWANMVIGIWLVIAPWILDFAAMPTPCGPMWSWVCWSRQYRHGLCGMSDRIRTPALD